MSVTRISRPEGGERRSWSGYYNIAAARRAHDRGCTQADSEKLVDPMLETRRKVSATTTEPERAHFENRCVVRDGQMSARNRIAPGCGLRY